MIHLLDNYTFSPALRYDAHRLIYTYSEKEEPIQIEGFLGAALLCVRLINSDEGERREIPLDIERKQDFLFSRYEQEVIADGWGYLEAELRQLNDAYIQLTVSQVTFMDLCPNIRQFSIAMSLLSAYMQRLVTEEFGEHIWEKETWHMPFSQWLFDAGYTETVRKRFLHIDWTDPVAVNALVEMPEQRSEEPSFIFEGEEAEEIICRYWEWLSNTAQKEAALFPDKNVMMAEFKENILAHETNYDDLKPEMKDFTTDQLNLFHKWMNQWIDFVKGKIKPKKQITFWTKDVSEEKQEALLDYLKIQERQPQRYKCLAVTVYSLRQLGYITYNIAPSSIAKWLSERLMNDYSSKTNLYQFRRAWNELHRHHPDIKEEVAHLAEYGVKSIK